jgi:hypothetical protein
MSTITVFRPVDDSEPPTTVELAPRGGLPERPVIGIVDNRKPNARQILEILADEIGQRFGDCEIVLMQKQGAGNPMPPEMADDMAARAHLVITGVGD